MYPICSAQESLEVDRRVIRENGVPSAILIENAALAVAQYILRWKPQKIAILCGTGNNGADGIVVARKLASTGIPNIDVYIVSRSSEVTLKSDEGKTNLKFLTLYPNIQTSVLHPETGSVPDFSSYDIVVDALLGTGSGGSPDPFFQRVFDTINESATRIIAVDVPSGICPTTGFNLYARPIRASATVTLGTIKSGLVLYPAASFVGTLVLATISFPPVHSQWSLNLIPRLPPRDPGGHKGTFGRALFVAGCGSYFGAPTLASMSFLKSGGGYACLATEASVASVVAGHAPEVVMNTSREWGSCIGLHDVVVFGPGVGLGTDAVDRLKILVYHCMGPNVGRLRTVILDGDGITLFARDYGHTFLRELASKVLVILTPHVGEWKRLFPEHELENLSGHHDYVLATQKIISSIRAIFPVIVAVKGSRTGIISSSGAVRINTSGNSGMATCGSGDVLSGIVACLAAQRPVDQVFSAVGDAVFLHGVAGDIAATAHGCEDGVVASDIMNAVPRAIGMVRNSDDSLLKYFPEII